MATLFEYFDQHFPDCLKLCLEIPIEKELVRCNFYYDTRLLTMFVALYVQKNDKDLSFFEGILNQLKYGEFNLSEGASFILPDARTVQGNFKIKNGQLVEVEFQYFGDSEWFNSSTDFSNSCRIFIYSETDLAINNVNKLKEKAKEHGLNVQFRSEKFRKTLSMEEKPYAFICHDSNDKNIARNVASNLSKRLCPVWYDEFSLKVGDNLRISIEKGLKECKKCVIILSPKFISNTGWTKKEFDSIFTREILENKTLVLPIWYNVTKNDVYDYCPSLLNIKGINYIQLGEKEVCQQLFDAITYHQ
ncbi:MAG: toll/interleukin-1 receptor domain-containing protein [Nitrosomonas sp.]|jgi:hypothetical protein|nr:toll/interleukin-1 receptor domain-containing protein [Nitrosomonas sp.]